MTALDDRVLRVFEELVVPEGFKAKLLRGALELAGAVGVLVPATTRWAAACLALLLVAMFPANVSAARRGVAQGDRLGRRSAMQGVFVAAATAVAVLA